MFRKIIYKATFLAIAFLMMLSAISFKPFTVLAAQGSFEQDFSLESGVWGDSQDADVAAVLKSVLEVYEAFFGDSFVYDPQSELTIVTYKNGENSPYTAFDNSVIRLDSKDRRWAQLMYQFSHEIYHYLSHHQTDYIGAKQGFSVHSWFEEAICEAMSIIVLKQSAVNWQTNPPYSSWADYSESLTDYADGVIFDSEELYNEHNYANLHLAIMSEMSNLKTDPGYPNNERHVQGKIAIYMAEYFDEHDFDNISSALKTLMTMTLQYENLNFDDYIAKWYELSDTDGKRFVRYIADIMGMDAPSSWAISWIEAAREYGLTTDSLDTNYHGVTTRTDFCRATVNILRKYGYDVDSVTPVLFSDTSDRDIGIAAALGITNGTDVAKNLFSPNDPLTREQAATMLSNLIDIIGKMPPKSNVVWTDANDISSWAKEASDVMYAAKIIEGTSSDELVFSPKALYTHEQCIITFVKLWTYIKN